MQKDIPIPIENFCIFKNGTSF